MGVIADYIEQLVHGRNIHSCYAVDCSYEAEE